MSRFLMSATAVAALLSPALALAQPAAADPNASATAPAAAAAPKLAQGATVYDAQGATVGTIESLDGQFATLATAKSKAKLPLTAFGTGEKGPVIGMTAAQVDAAAGSAGAAAAKPAATADASAAATPAKLTKGAAVSDTKGAPVGTIEEVGAEFAVVATAKNKARLPLNAFAQTENGVVIGMSATELDAAADAAKPKGASK